MTAPNALLALGLLMLTACGHIIAADTQTTRAEKNLQPPRSVTPTPPVPGFYAFNLDNYALQITHSAEGHAIRLWERTPLQPGKPHPAPNAWHPLSGQQPYRNPLPVQLPAHPEAAYLQYDDSGPFKRVWMLDQQRRPVPCPPLQACRWNLKRIHGP